HRIGAVLREQARDQRAISDVAMHEQVVRVAIERSQRVAVARVGQRIEIDDADAVANGVQHEVATNETGAAGYEPSRHAVLPVTSFQNGMSSSAKSSENSALAAAGTSRRCGALRCGRSLRPPPPAPPSPPPPSICISSATMSVV